MSVAATKSFVASLAMLSRVTAEWANDEPLRAAIERLPDRLEAATDLDWSAALDVLAAADSLTTIGRGPTLAIAREAALKLKETCNLQAEPFSSPGLLTGGAGVGYRSAMFMPNDGRGSVALAAVACKARHSQAVRSFGCCALKPDHADPTPCA